MTPDVVVVSESRSDAEKMKEALARKEKTCRTINKVGTVLTTIGSPALVASLVKLIQSISFSLIPKYFAR